MPEKKIRLSFSTKKAAALARSQAPIVYHTRVQIWRRHTHMSWALASKPHGDDCLAPRLVCVASRHMRTTAAYQHTHMRQQLLQGILLGRSWPHGTGAETQVLIELPQCGLSHPLPLKRLQGLA